MKLKTFASIDDLPPLVKKEGDTVLIDYKVNRYGKDRNESSQLTFDSMNAYFDKEGRFKYTKEKPGPNGEKTIKVLRFWITSPTPLDPKAYHTGSFRTWDEVKTHFEKVGAHSFEVLFE